MRLTMLSLIVHRGKFTGVAIVAEGCVEFRGAEVSVEKIARVPAQNLAGASSDQRQPRGNC